MTRILVVEDDPKSRKLLVDVLNAHGCSVFEAGCGEDAIELLQDQPVDLALLDIQLPGIDGVETLRRLRRRSPHKDKPRAYAVTAALPNAALLADAGFCGVLPKPLPLSDLRAVLQGVRAPE